MGTALVVCTSASGAELVLIFGVIGAITALPVGVGIAAAIAQRRGWRIAAALATLLPLLFFFRNGFGSLVDRAVVASSAAFAFGGLGWVGALARPRLRIAALALVALGAVILVASIAMATTMGPTCEEMMAPPTATPVPR